VLVLLIVLAKREVKSEREIGAEAVSDIDIIFNLRAFATRARLAN